MGILASVLVLGPVVAYGALLLFRPAPKPGGETVVSPAGDANTNALSELTPANQGAATREAPVRPEKEPTTVGDERANAEPRSEPKPNGSAAVASEDAWKVLTLVSLEYSLDGKNHLRSHDRLLYLPLLLSHNAGARDVAALSYEWERDVWALKEAHNRRVESVENFIGARTPRPPGAGPDPTQLTDPPELKSAFAQAVKAGALAAFQGAKFWPEAQRAFDEKHRENIAEMFKTSANYYRVQVHLARMQVILWDRAEALAKATANGDNARGDDIQVKGVFETGKKWGTVTIRNRSNSDLEHITLAVKAPVKPLGPGSPGMDFVLGAGVSAASGENNPAKNKDAGNQLADSVADDREFRSMPVRVFVHVPKLAPGSECEVRVFRTSMEFAKTQSAAYSLWAAGVTVEGRPLPGYDAAQAAMRARAGAGGKASNPSGNSAVAGTPKPGAADLFATGSVWRGTMTGGEKGKKEVTHQIEIIITERDGDKFKGVFRYNGKQRNNIEGTVTNNEIKWEYVVNGKSGNPVSGKVDGKHMVTTFSSTNGGVTMIEGKMTLDYVVAGKKQPSRRR
jgi:hypothetical protein